VTGQDVEARGQWQFGPELRAQLTDNLARHDRIEIPDDGRRHAAVAVVVVDSDALADGEDLYPTSPDKMREVPGAAGVELTGTMAGTSGERPGGALTPATGRCRAAGSTRASPASTRPDGSSRRSSGSTCRPRPCWGCSTTTPLDRGT
jgi:hypothetical protein